MENVMTFYFILFMILGLVIYHSMFDIWYFNLGKALISEIIGAALFGALMTGLTLMFWWVSLIIIILIGLALSAKVNNPNAKKIIIGVFVVIAIITAITGINYNRQKKEEAEEAERQEQAEEEEIELYYTPTDPGVYLKGNKDYDQIIANTTYVCKDKEYVFANVLYDSDTYGMMDVHFFIEDNGTFYSIWSYSFENNVVEPLIYGNADAQITVNDDDTFTIGGEYSDDDGIYGTYKLASEEDVSYYDTMIQSQLDYQESYQDVVTDNAGDYNADTNVDESISGVVIEQEGTTSEDYLCEDSTERELTDEDVETYLAGDYTDYDFPGDRTIIQMIINEMYARHGYSFSNEELTEYFSQKDWYALMDYRTDSMDEIYEDMSDIEKANIELLKQYQ